MPRPAGSPSAARRSGPQAGHEARPARCITLALRPERISLGERARRARTLRGRDRRTSTSSARSSGSGSSTMGWPARRRPLALDTFNEPHLDPPEDPVRTMTISFPLEAGSCSYADGAPGVRGSHRRRGVTNRRSRSTGSSSSIFDKDGTLIEFHPCGATGRSPSPRRCRRPRRARSTTWPLRDARLRPDNGPGPMPHGGLAATPMARLREAPVEALAGAGVAQADALGARGVRLARARSRRARPAAHGSRGAVRCAPVHGYPDRGRDERRSRADRADARRVWAS